jgi:hypothetical protein
MMFKKKTSRMPEVSGNSAHVHMDEGIDVVGLKDVELVEPKGNSLNCCVMSSP